MWDQKAENKGRGKKEGITEEEDRERGGNPCGITY